MSLKESLCGCVLVEGLENIFVYKRQAQKKTFGNHCHRGSCALAEVIRPSCWVHPGKEEKAYGGLKLSTLSNPIGLHGFMSFKIASLTQTGVILKPVFGPAALQCHLVYTCQSVCGCSVRDWCFHSVCLLIPAVVFSSTLVLMHSSVIVGSIKWMQHCLLTDVCLPYYQ